MPSDANIAENEPDTDMSELASLRSNLRGKIHNAEVILRIMTTPPVQNLIQEIEYDEYTMRIHKLILVANGNFLEIEAEHRNDIEAAELAAFRTSLALIEHRISVANAALAWTTLSRVNLFTTSSFFFLNLISLHVSA